MNKQTYDMVERLISAGIARDDAWALRRISMTLHRWHELECGDSNDYASWCITRGRRETRHGQHSGGHGAHYVFIHDDNGAPFLERHAHNEIARILGEAARNFKRGQPHIPLRDINGNVVGHVEIETDQQRLYDR